MITIMCAPGDLIKSSSSIIFSEVIWDDKTFPVMTGKQLNLLHALNPHPEILACVIGTMPLRPHYKGKSDAIYVVLLVSGQIGYTWSESWKKV